MSVESDASKLATRAFPILRSNLTVHRALSGTSKSQNEQHNIAPAELKTMNNADKMCTRTGNVDYLQDFLTVLNNMLILTPILGS